MGKPVVQQAPLPFSVAFQNNEVLNRTFIDVAGYFPITMAVTRNIFERAEKILEMAAWVLWGLLVPVLLEKAMAQPLSQKIRNRFQAYFQPDFKPPTHIPPPRKKALFRLFGRYETLGESSVLRVPWEWLDQTFQSRMLAGNNRTQNEALVKTMGFHSLEHAQEALNNPVFKRMVRRSKIGLALINLAWVVLADFMAQWGKNWMTHRLSGRHGFSGEFGYATEDYLNFKSSDYHEQRNKRLLESCLVTGLGGILSFPLVMNQVLTSTAKTGLVGKMKRWVPAFNFHHGIFMSKWVMLWESVFNWLALGGLAARDTHELREHLTKISTILLFYTVGDDLIASTRGKFLEKNHKLLQQSGIRLVQSGTLGIPEPVPLEKILRQLGGKAEHPIYKLALRNYWLGILSTIVAIAAVVPLINNWYTKRRVLQEEHQLTAPPMFLASGLIPRKQQFEEYLQRVYAQKRDISNNRLAH